MIPQAKNYFTARFVEEVYDYQNILLYSDFGAGKTWLAASAVLVPEMCDVLYISLEGGERTLREIARLAKSKGVDPNRILVVPIQTYSQYSNVYEFLKIHINARDTGNLDVLRGLEAQIRGLPNEVRSNPEALKKAIPNPLKIRTVITDSLTEAQKYCMYQLLGIDPLTQKLDAEPDAAQFQD